MKATMRKRIALAFILASACRAKSPAQDGTPTPPAVAGPALPDEPNARLEVLVRANLDAELALRPTMASWLGDHGYDDKLEDVRTDAQLREASRLRVLGEQLRALPDAKLSASARLDLKLLVHRTDAALHELSEMRPLERSPLFYVDIAQAGVDSLVEDLRPGESMSADTLRSLNGRMSRIRGLFDEARRNLRGTASELAVRRAIDTALDDATKALVGKPPLNTLLPPQRPDPERMVEDDHAKAEELTLKTQLIVDAIGTWGHDIALLPVPPTGLPRVLDMPPQLSGLAQLDANGPLEKHPRPPVFYLEPATTQPSEKARTELLRTLNRSTLVLTLSHDLLGHFLVGLARRQAPTLMQRVSASLLLDEGFATYAERRLLDGGPFADDPKIRFVVERETQLRLLRLLASIRFHAQAARFDDVVRLFAEQTDLDDTQARREAERVALDPFAGAEALGWMEIDRLRSDWQAAHPTSSLRELHNALLAHGGTPIEMLRELLLRAE
jgi:uncharacterized protein (DUF885 family)